MLNSKTQTHQKFRINGNIQYMYIASKSIYWFQLTLVPLETNSQKRLLIQLYF